MSIIAFKDIKLLSKNSLINKLVLQGNINNEKNNLYCVCCNGSRIVDKWSNYLVFASDAFTHAHYIQFKRALLYVHFGSSVLIMFFLMDFVYSALIAVKGNLKGLITGNIQESI
ncbi:hypothetical protein ACN2C3_03395 [Aliarcobacter butzleri]